MNCHRRLFFFPFLISTSSLLTFFFGEV
jgi:hypothetical protein